MKQTEIERSMQTQMRWEGLPTPICEYLFDTEGRKWRFDFAWEDDKYRIAVECEGGTWIGGAHVRGKGFEDNCRKYNQAARLGWRVFRFTTDMINNGEAGLYMKKVFEELED